MADFCRQCAIKLQLGGCDLDDLLGVSDPDDVLKPGEGYYALCEGCGGTRVDWAGQCLGDCGNPNHRPKKLYITRQQYFEDKKELDKVFDEINERLNALNHEIYGPPPKGWVNPYGKQ